MCNKTTLSDNYVVKLFILFLLILLCLANGLILIPHEMRVLMNK